jgi:hypothetical protein
MSFLVDFVEVELVVDVVEVVDDVVGEAVELFVEDVVVEIVDDFVEVVELVDEEVVLAERLAGAVYMQEQALCILDGIACYDDAHFGTVINGTWLAQNHVASAPMLRKALRQLS